MLNQKPQKGATTPRRFVANESIARDDKTAVEFPRRTVVRDVETASNKTAVNHSQRIDR